MTKWITFDERDEGKDFSFKCESGEDFFNSWEKKTCELLVFRWSLRRKTHTFIDGKQKKNKKKKEKKCWLKENSFEKKNIIVKVMYHI